MRINCIRSIVYLLNVWYVLPEGRDLKTLKTSCFLLFGKENVMPDSLKRTVRYFVEKNDPAWAVCDDLTFKAKNLYNVVNYWIRQVMSGIKKKPEERYAGEQEVLALYEKHLSQINKKRKDEFDAKGIRYTKKGELLVFHPYEQPTAEHWFLPPRAVRETLAASDNPDYRALPCDGAQNVVSQVMEAWKSYFAVHKKWKKDKSSLSGQPRIPGYLDKNGRYCLRLPARQAVLRKEKDETHVICIGVINKDISISKTPLPEGEYKMTRIIPDRDRYVIELVFDLPASCEVPKVEDVTRIASIDLGVANFATVSSNTGIHPLILRGGFAKAANQWYNKQTAYYRSILTQGQDPKKGTRTSKRIRRITDRRNRRINDFIHKASRIIADWAAENNIQTIVIGCNTGWKQEVDMGKKNNQNFVQVPFERFISLLTYKAEEKGILVIETEESYTSSASFLDEDKMPVYGKKDNEPHAFSGRRVRRGWYQGSSRGINADVNGSANIARKAFPQIKVSEAWKAGVLQTPKTIHPVQTGCRPL